MTQEPITRSNAHQWLATAYHEAGHAVVMLQLGRQLLWVEVTAPGDGLTMSVGVFERMAQLTAQATHSGRMPAELLRLWREEFWISDAGMVAAAQFNLVPVERLARGGLGDAFKKLVLIPDEVAHPVLKAYFHRHLGSWAHPLKEECQRFFRLPRIATMTTTLAEALLRARRLDGDEVIDVLLANRAHATGQLDLFWLPPGDEPLVRSKLQPRPRQLRLL
ncbi:MAG TPA: M50 family metallopeptidase [Gammaproteobacteria bacterium]